MSVCASSMALLQTHRDHPDVLRVYDRATADRLLSLWNSRHQLIDRGHQLSPLSLCHGDTSGRNLYHLPGEPDHTAAIDWYYVGLEPMGLDVARLLGSSLHWFFIGRMDQAARLEEAIGEGYLSGLRDVGWSGDLAAIRETYRIAAATIYGLSYPHIVDQILRSEVEDYGRRNYGCSGEQVVEHRSAMGRFFSRLV
jgi:hypothetical protein